MRKMPGEMAKFEDLTTDTLAKGILPDAWTELLPSH